MFSNFNYAPSINDKDNKVKGIYSIMVDETFGN